MDPAHSAKKAWLIDLDGTLYRAPLLKLAMAAEVALFGLGALSIIKPFRKAHEQLHDELHADPSREFSPSPFAEQIRRAAAASGKSEADVERVVRSWMIDRPAKWLRPAKRKSLLDEIVRFRASGGKTAVVSDYPAQRKLRSLGVAELFDAVVSSGETEGLTRLKPCPDGFLRAAKLLSVEPHDCLVIGDRDDADGAAARAAGMAFRLID